MIRHSFNEQKLSHLAAAQPRKHTMHERESKQEASQSATQQQQCIRFQDHTANRADSSYVLDS